MLTAFVGLLATIGHAYDYPNRAASSLIDYSVGFFTAPVDGFTSS